MWFLNVIVGNNGKINTFKFDSKPKCEAFLEENGLLPSFVGPEWLWWVVSPEGKVLVR